MLVSRKSLAGMCRLMDSVEGQFLESDFYDPLKSASEPEIAMRIELNPTDPDYADIKAMAGKKVWLVTETAIHLDSLEG